MSQIQKVPEHIGDHYFEVRQYNKDNVQFIQLPLKKSVQPITIGRTNDNHIQILNNTVSKHHAKITSFKHKHYLYDLDSINGTYINGNKVKPNEEAGIIIYNGDSIQFGKYQCLYIYRDRAKSVKSKSKGKINLKDYMFEDVRESPKNQKNIHFESPEEKVKPKKKARNKIKEGKIKIPDIANYLQLQSQIGNNQRISEISDKNSVKLERKKVAKKEGRVKLPNVEEDYLTGEERKNYELHEKEKNVYLLEEQTRKEMKEKQKRLKEERLQIQVQKERQSQDLLQRQLIMEQRLKMEQERIEEDRKRLEEQFIKREQEKRENEMRKIEQLQYKERELMERLQKERERQLEEIKKKQEEFKVQSQNQYRNEYESRKKQLQVQAQALARQYENIYRETIKKVRNEIQFQQNGIQKLERQIQKNKKEDEAIVEQNQKVYESLNTLKRELIKVGGRNRACVLYASEIQNKIDTLKENSKNRSNQGYYNIRQGQNSRKMKESIMNSRRLLKIKRKQYESLWSQLIAVKGSFHELETYSDISQFLQTIFENSKIIEKLKQEYLECLQSEKGIEEIWESELQENNELEERNRLYHGEIRKNIQEIDENTRDQMKKSTEQRLHMLKIIHMCSENKKSAAKFLIEEMLTVEQQIHKFMIENEEIHKKIVELVSKTEVLKRDNEYLSEILFGHDGNGHHFDNMKYVINNLIEKIEVEKEQGNVEGCLKIKNQGSKIQLKIQEELDRKKGIKENMRKVSELGLAPVQIRENEKNPLIFFGDLLTNKQMQIDRRNTQISRLQNEIVCEKQKIRVLQERRKGISTNLQRFKVEQLSNARKYLDY